MIVHNYKLALKNTPPSYAYTNSGILHNTLNIHYNIIGSTDNIILPINISTNDGTSCDKQHQGYFS